MPIKRYRQLRVRKEGAGARKVTLDIGGTAREYEALASAITADVTPLTTHGPGGRGGEQLLGFSHMQASTSAHYEIQQFILNLCRSDDGSGERYQYIKAYSYHRPAGPSLSEMCTRFAIAFGPTHQTLKNTSILSALILGKSHSTNSLTP